MKPYQHPAKTAQVNFDGKVIGTISVLHPQFLPHKPATVALAELEVNVIAGLISDQTDSYQKLSAFPSVHRDLSLVMPESVLMADVVSVAQAAAQNLESMDLFDEYRDAKKLGPDLKNLAFHVSFRSKNQTMTEEMIEADMTALVTALKTKLNAQLRLDFDNAKMN